MPRGRGAGQIGRAESDISDKQREFLKESCRSSGTGARAEQKRTELLAEAEKEARETRDKAEREASQKLKDAEAVGQAAGAGAAPGDRADEQRSSGDRSVARVGSLQGTDIVRRAREGAEQLLGAAGLGGAALDHVVKSIAGEPENEPEEELASGRLRRSNPLRPPASTSSDSDGRLALR